MVATVTVFEFEDPGMMRGRASAYATLARECGTLEEAAAVLERALLEVFLEGCKRGAEAPRSP